MATGTKEASKSEATKVYKNGDKYDHPKYGKVTIVAETLNGKETLKNCPEGSHVDINSAKFGRFEKAFGSMGNKVVHSTERSYEYMKLMKDHEKLTWAEYWKMYADTAKAYADERTKNGQGSSFKTKDYSAMTADEKKAEADKLAKAEAKIAAQKARLKAAK